MIPKIIVVAGASGFVGKNLLNSLRADFPDAKIIALSREAQTSSDDRLIWKPSDLFSEESIYSALPEKIDLAYYLVHSMSPTAQLDQGNFADYDLIMADNFAAICRAKECKQLIYLSGLIPEHTKLSLHLQSRLEVEEVFKDHNLPTTIFRAGLILGDGGSSFQILLKLILRLRVMVCPSWTQTLNSPVDLPTVVTALTNGAKSAEHLHKTYDLAGCKPLTYLQMMQETARFLKVKRYFLTVPLFTPTLSRLWVSLVTNTSKNLVYPLIESLQHQMVAREAHLFTNDWQNKTYADLLRNVSAKVVSTRLQFSFKMPRKTVRSVQRIDAAGKTAREVADAYFSWLPKATGYLVCTNRFDQTIQLKFLNRVTLIQMQEANAIISNDRITYFIHGGLLVRNRPIGRLEFRNALAGRFTLVAIHDYAPALPWFIYKFTQAPLHLLVMKWFSAYLKRA